MTYQRTRREIQADIAERNRELKRLPIRWTEGRDLMHAAIDALLDEWEAAGA